MRFSCPHCSTQYRIPPEKLADRILRIRCKVCGNVLAVRDPNLREPVSTETLRPEAGTPIETQQPAEAQQPAVQKAPRPTPRRDSSDARVARPVGGRPATLVRQSRVHENWFIVRDGEKVGPMPFAEIRRLVADGELVARSYVWCPRFENWKHVEEVDDLKAAIPGPMPRRPLVAPLTGSRAGQRPNTQVLRRSGAPGADADEPRRPTIPLPIPEDLARRAQEVISESEEAGFGDDFEPTLISELKPVAEAGPVALERPSDLRRGRGGRPMSGVLPTESRPVMFRVSDMGAPAADAGAGAAEHELEIDDLDLDMSEELPGPATRVDVETLRALREELEQKEADAAAGRPPSATLEDLERQLAELEREDGAAMDRGAELPDLSSDDDFLSRLAAEASPDAATVLDDGSAAEPETVIGAPGASPAVDHEAPTVETSDAAPTVELQEPETEVAAAEPETRAMRAEAAEPETRAMRAEAAEPETRAMRAEAAEPETRIMDEPRSDPETRISGSDAEPAGEAPTLELADAPTAQESAPPTLEDDLDATELSSADLIAELGFDDIESEEPAASPSMFGDEATSLLGEPEEPDTDLMELHFEPSEPSGDDDEVETLVLGPDELEATLGFRPGASQAGEAPSAVAAQAASQIADEHVEHGDVHASDEEEAFFTANDGAAARGFEDHHSEHVDDNDIAAVSAVQAPAPHEVLEGRKVLQELKQQPLFFPAEAEEAAPSKAEHKQLVQEFSLMIKLDKARKRSKWMFVAAAAILVATALVVAWVVQQEMADRAQAAPADAANVRPEISVPERPTYEVAKPAPPKAEPVRTVEAPPVEADAGVADESPDAGAPTEEATRQARPDAGAAKQGAGSGSTGPKQPVTPTKLSAAQLAALSAERDEVVVAKVKPGLNALAGMKTADEAVDDRTISLLFQRRAKEIQRCAGGAAGKLNVGFTLSTEGRTKGISISSPDGQVPPATKRCMEGIIERWEFPPSNHERPFQRTLLLSGGL